MGGRPDRAADIGAGFEAAQTGRQRRRRTAGRAARYALEVPRAVGGSVDLVVALEIRQVERHVGLAEQNHAGGVQTLDRQGVALGDVVLHVGTAVRGRQAGDVVGFLDGHGHAMQRTPEFAFRQRRIGLARPRPFRVENDDGVERGIVAFDPAEIMFEQFQRTDVFRPNHGGEFGRGLEGKFRHFSSCYLLAWARIGTSIAEPTIGSEGLKPARAGPAFRLICNGPEHREIQTIAVPIREILYSKIS